MADQIVFDEQAVAESWDRNAKLRDELAARAGKPDNLETSPLDFGLGVAGSATSATGSLIKNLSLGDMSRALRSTADGSFAQGMTDSAVDAVTGGDIRKTREQGKGLLTDALGLGDVRFVGVDPSKNPVKETATKVINKAADVGTKVADSIDKHIVKPVAEPVGKAIEAGGETIKDWRSDDAKIADSAKLFTQDASGYHFSDAWGDPAKLVTRLADTLGTLAPTILAALVTKQAVAPMVTKSMIKRGMATETAALIGKATADRVAQNAVLVGGVGMSVGQSGDQAREAVTNLSHEELMNSPTYRENVRLINQDPNNQPLTSTQRLELARERTAEAAASYARSDPTTYAGAVAGTALGDSLLFKMITGKKAAAQVTGNILARTAKGFFKGGVGEGAGEAIEEGLQRNIANRTSNAVAGTDIDPMEGVGVAALEAGTLGMMTGGSVGAVTADIHGSSKPATSTDTNHDADTTPQTTIPSGVAGEVDVNTAIKEVAEGRKVPGAFSIGKDADGYRAAYINLGGELRVTQPFATAEEAQQTAIKATQIPTTQVPPTDEQQAAPVAPDDIANIPAYERQGNLSEELLAATQRTQTTPTDQTAAPVNEEQGVMTPNENPITGNPEEPAYTRAGTANPDIIDPLKATGRGTRTVSGEFIPAQEEVISNVPSVVEGQPSVTVDSQANEVIPEAQRLGYNGTINMGGQQGNGVNDNYAPPVTARRVTADQSLDTETVIDPRTPVGQAIVNAGSETDAIFEQLKTVRVTKKGKPFATQKEAQLASRASEMPVALPSGGFGVAEKSDFLTARETVMKQLQAQQSSNVDVNESSSNQVVAQNQPNINVNEPSGGQATSKQIADQVKPSPDMSGVPLSLISEFPDFPLTNEGYIPVNNLKEEERSALEAAGIVEDVSNSSGKTYKAVDPEHLWEERKRRQIEARNNGVDKSAADGKWNEGVERRAQAYERLAKEQEDLGDLGDADAIVELRAKAAEARGSVKPSPDTVTPPVVAMDNQPTAAAKPDLSIDIPDSELETPSAAGNAPEQAPNAPEKTPEQERDVYPWTSAAVNKYGTINLTGDPATLKVWAKAHGVTYGTSKDGIVVAKSSVPYVQSLIDQEADHGNTAQRITSDTGLPDRAGDGDRGTRPQSDAGPVTTESGNGRGGRGTVTAAVNEPTDGSAGSVGDGRNSNDHAVTTGKKATVHTPSGKQVKTEYRLMEAGDLTASHDFDGNTNPAFPQHLQPRDRSRLTARNQLYQIAQNPMPDRLTESAESDRGAPIVKEGVVESGNGRVIGLKEAYRRGNAAAYKQYLADHAANYGLTAEQVNAMTNPVLVRERLTEMTPEQVREFTVDSNRGAGLSLGATEQANADAAALTSDLLGLLSIPENGDVLSRENNAFLNAFGAMLGNNELAQYKTTEGAWNQAFKKRVENAIFAKGYGNQELLAEIAESTTPEVKNLLTGLMNVSAKLAELRNINNETGATLATAFADAAGIVARSRREGAAVKEMLAQNDMFGGNVNSEAGVLAEWLDVNARSAKKISDVLGRMTSDLLENARNQEQADIFTGQPATPRTVKDAINDERTRQEQQAANNQQKPGTDLFGANPPRLQPGQNGSVPGTTEQSQQGTKPEVKQESKTKITDFGEKIGGAKKDIWASIKDKMEGNTETEIGELPLSKSWPVPDYQNMLDAGTDPWVVALVRAARDIIPAKPRDAYKVARWSQQVKTLRELAVQVAEGALNSQTARLKIHEADLKSRAPASLAGLIDLYVTVGHSKDLSTLRISSGDFSLLNGVEYKPPKTLWYVEQRAPNRALSNWPRMIVTAETRPELLEKFKEKFNELPANPTPKQTTTFEIYSYGDGRGYFVGKKLGRNPVELSDTFASIKEARDYRDTHQAELADKLEKYKEIPKVRRDTNEPRVGEDMRNGQDVTPEMFGDTFGFRGVEFGNWVEQKRRQKDLNDAYDALMDLAAVLNVPPKALSLNGKLAMAFGARGNGGIDPAAAHYEPDSVVINLTKKNGAGSLGHEWWHALDNYFSNIRNQQGGAINITEARDVRLAARGSQYVHSGAVRNDMIAAFGKIIQATNDTEIKTRSQKLDDRRAKDYWTTEHEMTARMFEAYLISKLQDQNVSNDYLANIISEEEWSVGETIGFDPENSYPYPIAKEMGTIRGAFDNFFSVIDHRTDEDGKVALFSTIKPTTAEKAGKGMKIKEAEMVAREWLKQFKTDIKVHVVADQAAFGQAMEQYGFASTVQSGEIDNAAYLPSAKTVLINASAIKDPARLRQIMRHEILVHHGLRYVVGGDYYNKIINAIRHGYDTSAAIRAAANRVDSAYSDADVMTAFEEAFAHYAENRPTDSGFVGRWWRRVVNLIKTGLAKMGFIKQNESERVLDSVLDDIAENMRNGIENGTMVKGPFAKGKLPAKSINIEGMPTSITVDGKERTTVNSNGDQIASTEEEISNFWEWFGDSTNTNYDGEPLVFYHDSNDAFTKIKDGSGRFGGIFALKNQSSGYGKNSIGLYVKGDTMSLGELKNELSSMDDSGASLLSDILKEEIDPETAELITDALTDGSNYPNNEIVIDKIGAFDEATAQEQIQKLRGKLAKNFGFASIETPDEFDGDTIMIVDPLSIKSATGNNGQFDPTNDNILFSRAATADDLLTDTESTNSSSFGKADVLLHENGRRLLNRLKEQRKYGLGMLTDLQIDQIYREITGGAVGRYQKLRRQMESDRNDILLDAETRVEPMWEALGVEEKAAFSALIQDATMAQLHPDKALEENSLYKEVKDKLDKARKPETRAEYQTELDTLIANHRNLAERYRLTSKAGKDLYQTLRKGYDKQWSDLRAAIEQRITDIMGEGGKALNEKFRAEMEKALRHGPYFPLDRFGDYVVRARKGDQYIRRQFEKRDDAAAALKDFQAQGFNANMTVKEDRGGDQGNMHALGAEIMTLLDKAEEKGSSNNELKDAVWQSMLEMLPDASYAKHAIHRKRIKGASMDGHRAYLNNVYHYAYHISKIRYGHKMKAELDALNNQIKAGERGEDSQIKPEDLEVAQQVLNEMNKRHELNMNPKGSPIAGAMGNIGFLFHLGLSPAAAVVNLTQNVTVMLPQLAGKFGFLKASKFMLKAMGDYIRHGVFKAGTREAWVSLTRAADGTITADEKAMLNQLYKAGVLDLTQAHSIAARADTDQQNINPGKEWTRTGMRWAGALFHNAEVLNREVAALTAYRLLKDSDPNIDTEAMLDQVAGMVYDGHGDYAASNRPRYMRGDVMKVLTQFKIYSQMMTYTLFRNALKAAKGDMGALKTLGAMFGTTWLMAGAMGLPTPAVMLMYAIASGIDDDDDRSGEASFRLGLTEALGPELGELIAKGPLDAMTNLNISGRVALNQLWWRDPKEGTEGDDLTFHFMQQLAGPVLGIGVSAMRGLRDFGNGDIQRGIEGMSPKAIKDLAKAYRQTREGERTRKGDTIIDDVSVWNIAMQLAGFSSADMAKMYDAREYIKGKETKIDDERGKLLADYFDAYRSGDAEALQTVMQRVREFNEAHHQKERITGQTLTQSRQSRKRSMERTQAGTYLSKKREYLRSEGKFLE